MFLLKQICLNRKFINVNFCVNYMQYKSPFIFILSCLLLFAATTSHATTWYVRHNLSGIETGTSPDYPFISLDVAIAAAADGDTIKVAEGTYKPSQRVPGGSSDRDNAFYITKSLTLLGGYRSDFAERSARNDGYRSILDGDIGATGSNADNCYHVLVWNGATTKGAIDGFTIQNGNANGSSSTSGIASNHGAGILINAATEVSVSYVTFKNNIATGNGGAIYNGAAANGALSVLSSTFIQNTAGLGGALYSVTGDAGGFNKILNSTFSKNSATAGPGGAVYFSNPTASSSKVAYSTFNGNTASTNAGNAIHYPNTAVKELKGNLIYGNGTGLGTEINNLPPSSEYNLVRDQNLTGTGNITIAAGNAENIFQVVEADGSSGLDYYGGKILVAMPIRLGFAHNKIPGALAASIDPTVTDQRGDARVYDGAAEMGATEIDWQWDACEGNTTWYVDAASGATLVNGADRLQPINDLSMVLANPCLKIGDTIRVAGSAQGNGLIYRPTIILGSSTEASIRDRAFYTNKSITLLGGYETDKGFLTRNAAQYKTVLDGDWGVQGNNSDNSYHVVVWNTNDGREGSIDGFTIQNGNANATSANSGLTRHAGAGIYHHAGKLNIVNAILRSNAAGATGGAIHQNSELKISNSVLKENTAGAQGGAIYQSAGKLLLSNATLESNTSSTTGGGLYQSTDVSILNSVIRKNTAGAGGGGIYQSAGALNISGTSIDSNATVAQSGGGIYQNGVLTISTSSVSGNTAKVTGGGIYSNAALSVDHTSFMGNGASGTGTTDGGGAIYKTATGAATISKSTFANNSALLGGAIFSAVAATTNFNYISNSTFSGNRASGAGGGGAIYFSGAIANVSKITYSTFNANTAASNVGNAIRYAGTQAKEFKGNIVYGNGTGTGATSEILNLGTTTGTITYNIIRDLAVTGTSNVKNQNIPAGSASAIFANVVGDSAILADNGGLTPTLMIQQGGLAQSQIPSSVTIDTVRSDQRDVARSAAKLSIGAVELPVQCTPSKLWYVDAAAAGGGTGRTPASPVNNLSLVLNECLQAGDTIKVAQGTYTPLSIPFDTTITVTRDQTFLIPVSVHLVGGYQSGFNENTRDITGATTILDGDLGVAGTATDNAYHVVVWSTTDGQTGSINGFTIQNGNTTSAAAGIITGINRTQGAGVNLAQGKLTLINTIVQNNTATSTGGGIFSASGTDLKLINSVVSANKGTNGGGIYANGALTLSDKVEVTGNASTASTGGAGVYANNALTLAGKIVVTDNIASHGFGGIYKAATGSFNVSAVDTLIVTGNQAKNGAGGGIYSAVAVATGPMDFASLRYAEIKNNSASGNGGGIYATSALSFSKTAKVIIEDNKAGYNVTTGVYSTSTLYGGGIYAANALTLAGQLTLRGNIAAHSGGGIYKTNTGTFITVQLDSLIAENNESKNGSGGAIYTGIAADLFTPRGWITGNYAKLHGGAIFANSTFSISDYTISNNTTDGSGGGIYATGNLMLSGKMTFENNSSNATAAASGGGAVYANAMLDVASMDSLSMSNNTAKYSGGAIYTKGDVTFYSLKRGTFTGNRAEQNGGAIYAEKSVYMQNAVFAQNSVNAADGGALYIVGVNGTPSSIRRSTFSGNTAKKGGGAIYSGANNVIAVTQSTFAGNGADQDGGAIAAESSISAKHSFINNTFSGNSAGSGGALGFGYTSSSAGTTVNIAFCSFNYNSSKNGGSSAIYYKPSWAGGAGYLVGNIFYNLGSAEINNITGTISPSSQYNIVRGMAIPGTNNQNNLANGRAGDIFASVVGDSAALTDNGGTTQTLLIKEGGLGLAYNQIPQALSVQYATNDQRDRNRIVTLADIGSVELDESCDPSAEVTAWYVDTAATSGGNGKSAATAANLLETVLNDPCLKDGDTVKVAKGTYFSTDTDPTQSFLVSKAIVIRGGYANGDFSEAGRDVEGNKTILDGKSTSYHTVIWNSSDDYVSMMDGVTIQNGKATGSSTTSIVPQNKGGGVFLLHGNLVMYHTTVQNNIAANSGGGIFSGDDALLTLHNTRSMGNKAGYNGSSFTTDPAGKSITQQLEYSGGGVCAVGQLTLRGSISFQGDEAGVNGGGIIKGTFNIVDASQLDSLSMIGCVARVISTNQGEHGGGGIYTMCGLDLTAAKQLNFRDCKAPAASGKYGEGGGIFINNKTGRLVYLKVANAEFINCTCNDDGGAIESFGGTQSVVYAKDSYFKGCVSGRYGGAFGCGSAIELAGKIVIDSCYSGSNGGGISQWIGQSPVPLMFNATLLDTLIITRCGTKGVNINGGNAFGGGGLWVQQNDCDLGNLKYLHIADCYSGEHGGAIKMHGSFKLTLPANATFINNRAGWNGTAAVASRLGGAIYSGGATSPTCDVEVKGMLRLEGNTATQHGGGMYVVSKIIATALDTLIARNNKATHTSGSSFLGGAIYAGKEFEAPNLKYGDINDNYAKTNGGAIYAGNVFYIINCNFLRNKADGAGGAIWKSATGKLAIRKSTLAYNEAKEGGAVYSGITTGKELCGFVNSTFSQNKATAGSGGALYLNVDNATSNVSRIMFCTLNGNTATAGGDAVYYGNSTDELIVGSIIYGNGTQDINEVNGLSASYNVFKQSVGVAANNNIQVGNNAAADIFKTVSSPEVATLADNGGHSLTLALKVGGYAHNLAPLATANSWVNDNISLYRDERDSARFAGCEVDAGAFELQESEYDVSSYTLKQNKMLCANELINADTLITSAVNIKDTLYFSDRAYTQPLSMPTYGHSRIYVQLLSSTNCDFHDSISFQFTSVVPVADIVEATRLVCAGSTVQIAATSQPTVSYTWSGYAAFSDSYSGQNTNQLTLTAKSLGRDTSFYIYLTAATGCGLSKDSIKITLKGVHKVNMSIAKSDTSDACVDRPFNFTVSTKNTSYYIFLPSGLKISGVDQDGASVRDINSLVKYDSAHFRFSYIPDASDKGQHKSIVFRSTGEPACGYTMDSLNFLVLPEATSAKLELVSQPQGLQEICHDTVYTLKIKSTNIGGLVNNKVSLVDIGSSGILVQSAEYLYPVYGNSTWTPLGQRDSIVDLQERAIRYQYNNLPSLNGHDSMLVRIQVSAACGFKSNNAMKFKLNVYDLCGTLVPTADQVSKPFRLAANESNTYTFDNYFTPAVLNPKLADSVLLRVKVIISGSHETDSNTESIIADYPPNFVPDLNTFQRIHNADGAITRTPLPSGDIRHSITIPSGLKAQHGGGAFTDSVIFAVKCYTGNVPCGHLELWNQVFYDYTTAACGSDCQVTEVRAQSIDSIDVERYVFSVVDMGNSVTQVGRWQDSITLKAVTPFLANDSIKIEVYVDKDHDSRYSAGDVLVHTRYVRSGAAGVAPGGLVKIPLSNIQYQSGYQLIIYSDDAKQCNNLVAPFTIISGRDTVCTGDNASAIFEAPEGMLDYTFDAISGATTIPDATLAPNQIKKGFTTSGNKELSGTYRRIVYNEELSKNDTVQARYGTFKFYVNPRITGDSIDVLGGTTQLCTPSVVKLYAKNVKNAAAHRWMASTAAGALSGQNSDTLSYRLYPRSADTSIVVYYTATGLTSCGSWEDSIRLTLYQTLRQPQPAFVDSTICKNSNILLNLGVPSGGGSTTYTYQWQSKTRTTGWQNATGSYAGNTATDQNYLTLGLSDTTWYRRIATGKCSRDTSTLVKINVRSAIAQITFLQSKNSTICSGAPSIIATSIKNATGVVWTYVDNAGNREVLQPVDTIDNIGYVAINSTRDTVVFTSLRQTSDATVRLELTANDMCGDVKDTATVTLRAYATGKIVLLQDTNVCFGTPFNFANVVTNSTYMGFEAVRVAGLAIKDIITPALNAVRDSIINTYLPIEAEADTTITLKMKWRNETCGYLYDSVRIFVLPHPTDMELSFVQMPVTPQDFCTDTSFTLKVKASDAGPLKNVRVTLADEYTTRIAVDSAMYRYPPTSGQWVKLPPFTQSGSSYTFTTPDLPGRDSMLVRIHAHAGCEFTSGNIIQFVLQAANECGATIKPDTLDTEPLKLMSDSGSHVKFDFSQTTISTHTIDSRSGDTISVRVKAVLYGTNATEEHDRIMIATPEGMQYIPSSFVNISNADTTGGIEVAVIPGAGDERYFTLQSGLKAGDTVEYSYKLLAKNMPCGSYKIHNQAFHTDSVECGTSCEVYLNLGEIDENVAVKYYQFGLDTIKGYIRAGYWHADVNLKAINGFYAGDSLKVEFYVDENNNNFYDPADGSAVATRYIKSNANVTAGGILRVRFDNIPATYGKQLVAYSTDPLLCATTQFPITTLTATDEICTSDTTLVVMPEGMTNYRIDAITGATAVPLPGSSPSNYPNERIRQIRWTAARTVDTVAISGNYIRTYPGGITMPSERATFIARITNAITHSGLSMVGSTQEACSPGVVKIAAQNVKYATARQWTASTEVGTLINATTDTLTYAIKPYHGNDTSIWIVYHATAAGTCKDLIDSIQLTIYEALKQSAPGFLDSTVCKSSTVDINIDEPVGGGIQSTYSRNRAKASGRGTLNAAAYTYQWQDSTSSRGWQNVTNTGSTESYTTAALSDTTWFRRIVTAKCDSDTSAVVRIAVYPQLKVRSIATVYPLCMGDSIRIQLQIKGGQKPYMYSIDGAAYKKISNIDNITPDGYTACHVNALLPTGSYTVSVLDSSLCPSVDSVIAIHPNSASVEPSPNMLFVKRVPSGRADGSSWDNAFDGKYLAWYLRNRAASGAKVYVAQGIYMPYVSGCDTAARQRFYSFVLNTNIELRGGYSSSATGVDTTTTHNPKSYITRLSGEIQGDANNANNSYHVVSIAQNVGVLLSGFYISGGYADGSGSLGRGGGIYDAGGASSAYFLNNLVVENNAANSGGGMYFNENPNGVRISNATVHNNTALAASGGAGIFVLGNFLLEHSTVSGSIGGAGVATSSGDLRIHNSTISGNSISGINADNSGSGALVKITLQSATIANNGTGIRLANSVSGNMRIDLNNTLVVNNTGQNTDFSGSEPVDTVGLKYTIIGQSKYETATGDVKALPMPVALASLADNGGWGNTHALLNPCENPAVQSGNVSLLAMQRYDQRMVLRKNPPSIGAYDNDYTIVVTLDKPAVDTVCANTFYQISGVATLPFGVTGGYQWYQNGASLADSTRSSVTFDTIKVANGGKYTLLVTTNVPGCSRMSDTVNLFVRTAPQATVTDNATICEGDSITITFTLTSGEKLPQWGVKYTLEGVEQPPLINNTGTDTIEVAVRPTQTCTYSLIEVTDGKGCVTAY